MPNSSLTPIDHFDGQYEFLSNFSNHRVLYCDLWFDTNEHAFQWRKAVNKKEAIAIQFADTPGKAKRLGRKCHLVSDWEQIKDQVMLDIVRLKFSQHTLLQRFLLATGDRPLIEGNTWNDTYWGVCKGIGKNKLGKILEKVRQELRESL